MKREATEMGELDWDLDVFDDHTAHTEQITCALLHSIRNELRTLNRYFAYSNFRHIPQVLSKIDRNTRRKIRKARAK